jgi:hypothetical protein
LFDTYRMQEVGYVPCPLLALWEVVVPMRDVRS